MFLSTSLRDWSGEGSDFVCTEGEERLVAAEKVDVVFFCSAPRVPAWMMWWLALVKWTESKRHVEFEILDRNCDFVLSYHS